MTDTETKLRKLVATELGVDPAAVAHDATFKSLGADSLDGISIAMAVEDEFGIDVADDDISEATTFGEALALVGDKVAA